LDPVDGFWLTIAMLILLRLKINNITLVRSAFRNYLATWKAAEEKRAILAWDPNDVTRIVIVLICNSVQPCYKCPKHLSDLAESLEYILKEEIKELDSQVLLTDLILSS
jgi:hypothetical protein